MLFNRTRDDLCAEIAQRYIAWLRDHLQDPTIPDAYLEEHQAEVHYEDRWTMVIRFFEDGGLVSVFVDIDEYEGSIEPAVIMQSFNNEGCLVFDSMSI